MGKDEIKVLIFSINNELYATDIMEVERILGYENPTKLPDAPDFLYGVITYEKTIIPVISLSQRFSHSETQITENSKVIVSKQNEERIGIVVDEVSEVRNVALEDIEKPFDKIAGISKRYIKGLIKINGGIIVFLNLINILTEDEKKLLS
jgi:purine-binding chemotaxis protein CheW